MIQIMIHFKRRPSWAPTCFTKQSLLYTRGNTRSEWIARNWSFEIKHFRVFPFSTPIWIFINMSQFSSDVLFLRYVGNVILCHCAAKGSLFLNFFQLYNRDHVTHGLVTLRFQRFIVLSHISFVLIWLYSFLIGNKESYFLL